MRRAQYEWSFQEKEAWREMFLIVVFLGFGANKVDILENIIEVQNLHHRSRHGKEATST